MNSPLRKDLCQRGIYLNPGLLSHHDASYRQRYMFVQTELLQYIFFKSKILKYWNHCFDHLIILLTGVKFNVASVTIEDLRTRKFHWGHWDYLISWGYLPKSSVSSGKKGNKNHERNAFVVFILLKIILCWGCPFTGNWPQRWIIWPLIIFLFFNVWKLVFFTPWNPISHIHTVYVHLEK